MTCRNLVLVLGDQLDADSAALDGFDPKRDAVWMAEVAEESTHAWSHKARIALFLSAMRHYRDALRARGFKVQYTELDDAGNSGTLARELARAVKQLAPKSLVVVEPGDHRIREMLRAAATQALADFVKHRLPHFGEYQDAMWSGEPYLYHARLSSSMNLKLLNPRAVVEAAELPNTLGMSQFADGGIMASKPYCASGKYIQRMSNYCKGCRYDPAESTGARACPFTTLYWDFLMRHERRLAANPRTVMQVKNLARMDEAKRAAIRVHAQRIALELAE